MTTRLRSRLLIAWGLASVLVLGLLVWTRLGERPSAVEPDAPAGHPSQAVRTPVADLGRLLPEHETRIDDWRTQVPESFTLRLTPDLAVPFRITKVEPDARRTVVTARIANAATEQNGLEGAFLVGTATAPDRWDAVVVFPGIEYRIRVRGSEVSIEEAPSEPLVCLADDTPAASAAAVTAAEVALAATEDTPTVDVLALVNEQALAERNNDMLRIDADCANYVAASNAVLENSRITAFVWRYLLVLPAPAYTTDDELVTDLEAMRRGSLSTHVTSLKSVYGADQVMMLAGGIKTDAAGYAYVGGSSNLSTINYPFPTFSNGRRSTVTTSYFTFCHELAHNFGSRHARSSGDSDAIEGDGLYQYGHRFTDPESTSTPVETVGTIMATGSSYRIPYYSHPEITFRGVPIGVAATQPTAAHNARFLGERAPSMVASASSVTLPAIVQQPRSVEATLGQAASLSVTATGNSLTYRWTKDGAAITNATSATLSFAAVSAADAGSYRVTVSNVLGSATSDAAVVSLVAPAAPTGTTATAPTASSGGGGGGAFSEGFLAALALLAALHSLRSARLRRDG